MSRLSLYIRQYLIFICYHGNLALLKQVLTSLERLYVFVRLVLSTCKGLTGSHFLKNNMENKLFYCYSVPGVLICLVGLNMWRRTQWVQNLRAGVQMRWETCPPCVWNRSTPSTTNSSTICGWWRELQLFSFASSGSEATCGSVPQPSEPSSGAHFHLLDPH